MAKNSPSYRCEGCQATHLRWMGKCSKCGEFGTVSEYSPPAASRSAGLKSTTTGINPSQHARRLDEISQSGELSRISTGLNEFDRVLGGGLVPGQVVLLGGPPGVGKSTLLLSVANAIAQSSSKPVLYISGEESCTQIATRAHRIGATNDSLLITDDSDLDTIIGHIEAHTPDLALVIVDSLQAVASSRIEGRVGGVAQVLEVSHTLTRVAKSIGVPLFLVGQVTKDSNIAGPNQVSHAMDTVISAESNEQTALRLLRATKNRFGAAGAGSDIAAFEQTDHGMVEVPDPSSLFRETHADPVPGTCVTVNMDGARALVTEVQALVAPTNNPNPRRGVSGLDSNRVNMLIALSERAAGLKLFDKDVYTASVGGMRLSDPAADLAICIAVMSSAHDIAIPTDIAAIGEVALTGAIRRAPFLENRVKEASRLGYTRLFTPPGTQAAIRGSLPKGTVLLEAPNLGWVAQALRRLAGTHRGQDAT